MNQSVFLLTQAQLDEYIRRLEEAERNIRTAEAKISDRDQRISELERLLDCMGKVRYILNVRLAFFQIIKQYSHSPMYIETFLLP